MKIIVPTGNATVAFAGMVMVRSRRSNGQLNIFPYIGERQLVVSRLQVRSRRNCTLTSSTSRSCSPSVCRCTGATSSAGWASGALCTRSAGWASGALCTRNAGWASYIYPRRTSERPCRSRRPSRPSRSSWPSKRSRRPSPPSRPSRSSWPSNSPSHVRPSLHQSIQLAQ